MYTDPDGAFLHDLRHLNGLVFAGVGQGVAYQVIDHLADAGFIGNDGIMLFRRKADRVAIGFHQFADTLDDLLHRSGQVEGGRIDRHNASLQAGKIKHFPHQAGKARCFIDDDLHILRRVFIGDVPHHLGIAADHGQRGAQIMADVGDQLVLEPLHLAQILRSPGQRGIQLSDLSVMAAVPGLLKPAEGQLPGGGVRFNDGSGNIAGDQGCHPQSAQQHHQGDQQQLGAQRGHRGIQRRDDGIEKQEACFAGGQHDLPGIQQALMVGLHHGRWIAGKPSGIVTVVPEGLNIELLHQRGTICRNAVAPPVQVTDAHAMDQAKAGVLAGQHHALVFVQHKNAHVILRGKLIRQHLHLIIIQVFQYGSCGRGNLVGFIVAVKIIQPHDLKQPEHGDHKGHEQHQVQHDAAPDAHGLWLILFQSGIPPLAAW